MGVWGKQEKDIGRRWVQKKKKYKLCNRRGKKREQKGVGKSDHPFEGNKGSERK